MTSLRDRAYEELRRRILATELAPGQRLIERDLAAELEVSRIPLREALRLLEADGLVLLVPAKGALVAPFTPADVRDLFDVRESLEALAARLTASRRDDSGLARLKDRLAAARAATVAGDSNGVAAANAGFHTDLVELSANPLLSAMMRPLEARTHWLFRLTAQRDPAQQCAEHEELYAAIEAGDEDRAARLAHEHVTSGRETSIAQASLWSEPDVDPEAVAARRRRRPAPRS
ncbi:DNA-binding GntR family transcriptional regulator [Actinoplanes lutulentus]|uniref:GntR family transcriptional regulator n=1 Tax=Actinoplanes lutulentus TaxID=1287878 RepID=A0A327Z719_9ACTN|nr:GntR family transcriptional regulator [Actinoplanes lutulentus]MBB2943067.1 DNA-binding GntR family transcriptional regulator [Actinoplanes lutulentus]RAK26667.1 GntR family transcriptional regulator [Actinoplanes lutulentus]